MEKREKRTLVLGIFWAVICVFSGIWGLLTMKGYGLPVQPAWYYSVCFGLSGVSLLCLLVLLLRAKDREQEWPLWLRLLFSDRLLRRSNAARLAYIAVGAALCIVSNMFELKFATTQFSCTVFTSCLAGILLGALPGFLAVFLGDGIGYLVNGGGYMYYWWVALACACMALIAGLVMRLPLRFRGALYVRLAFISLLTFFVCSVGINTTGMYYLGLSVYMPSNVLEAAEEVFGGRLTFWTYTLIRFGVLGQVWNSLVNYALLFLLVPPLSRVRSLGL